MDITLTNISEEEALVMLKAKDSLLVISDIIELVRNKLKYSELDETTYSCVKEIYEGIFESVEDRGVTLLP